MRKNKGVMPKNIGMIAGWNRGKKMSKEWRKKLSEAKLRNPVRYWKGKHTTSGKDHYNWQGGKTTEREKLRKSIEYKLWRTSVFRRDKYTCVFCGQVGGKLEADHIKPWCDYPELRFAIDNGRTLCVECHRKTDTYLMITGRNQYTKCK
jgi:5-methylcytosine-specific restriction endonuclease McrA